MQCYEVLHHFLVMYARLTKYRSRDNPVTIVRKVANSHSFFAADGQIDGFSEVQA